MGRIFNIGGPPPASLHDIAELLVRLAGPPARYITREFPADRATIDIGSYHADDSAFRAATGWKAAGVAGGGDPAVAGMVPAAARRIICRPLPGLPLTG